MNYSIGEVENLGRGLAIDIRKRKLDIGDFTSRLENCLHAYKSPFFVFNVRCLVLSLPVK